MSDALALYLDSRAGPFDPGKNDCGLLLADWIVQQRPDVPDPAGEWRGLYDTEMGFLRILARHGGLEGVVRHAVARAGLETAVAAQRGDVGVIRPLGSPITLGGIYTGRLWAFLGFGGMCFMPAERVIGWHV